MWAILAVIAFLAGQVYLFRSLGKVDRFFAQQEELPEKEILSIAFADPGTAEQMAGLLAGFSRANPEIEMVLHTDPAAPDAVYEGRAAVGFLPVRQDAGHGLGSFALNHVGLPEQKIIWKSGAHAACADMFVEYLKTSVGADSGNPF